MLARVHPPELRVVFNNEVGAVPLGMLVCDGSRLVVSPWPVDVSTVCSLEGSASGGEWGYVDQLIDTPQAYGERGRFLSHACRR